MRNKFAQIFFDLAKKDKKLRLIAADISPAGDFGKLIKKFPDKFINIGVAETSMISLCAGLAMTGLKPFAYTISTFALYRPFEMIRDDLCYQNLPVTIVGMGSGTIYSNLGPTHMSQEDISIARSIPNMQVISLCDPFEIKYCLNYLTKFSKHPTYLRIGKSGETDITTDSLEPWKFGRIRKIAKGNKVCFIGHGPILKKLININSRLKKFNISASIYEAHTLKPFDQKRMKNIFKNYTHIFSIEDHSIIGGLQSLIKELAYEYNFKGIYHGFSLKDQFIKSYGSQDELLKLHGLSEDSIFKNIKKKLKIK
ncbi:transketolase C-terminal domain-containing protein [Candidatus Pelagibacter sp.]|jgi:transketolase|nr:transketolase C-terminal domain-containing protein [Candidatus Pelagibacter sp.]